MEWDCGQEKKKKGESLVVCKEKQVCDRDGESVSQAVDQLLLL